ncbi:TonB-dependent receptor [Leptospira fainei serovar Hurstbridge str. BUT 6]|uniref:TonB-dependent receptor n=1 Tax=Leptospira fainei serovar Hurstbridge str. BUT 6 TaxID=1193011 RepID=S3W2S8_9LEPT|nr:TonB-dependent receptor [Leptospira fainei]EPG74562.1 TonB-dependent receptor [Leptospira fainei serovar Hurstbridge str. BUT 6]
MVVSRFYKISFFLVFFFFAPKVDAQKASKNDAPNVQEFGPSEAKEAKGKSDSIEVRAKSSGKSASEGRIGSDRLKARPIYATGEIAEAIPGVIVTQHSGGGKANQYFLRGFNLDHGTDFSTSLNGVPINNPSHAHGQGYTDLNFIIPELIQEIHYKKGVYYVDEGDFSSAGAMQLSYFKSLTKGIAKIEGGTLGFGRFVVAKSEAIGSGTLLYSLEYSHSDGPWSIPDNYKKLNSLISYSKGDEKKGISIQILGHKGSWHATNQIPERSLQKGKSWVDPNSGGLDRYDSVDPTDGGKTQRANVMFEAHRTGIDSEAKIILYGVYYDFNLFSNFTYFLDDHVRGDQVDQVDRRSFAGGKAFYKQRSLVSRIKIENTLGIQVRRDYILNDLYHTESRSRLESRSIDRIVESSISPYFENQIRWSEKIRSFIGVRGETFLFDVQDRIQNVGIERKVSIANPKSGLTIGPWLNTEVYINAGYGFHSNDARGLLNKTSPSTPLVRTRGGELGLKTAAINHLMATLAFWRLDLDSELVYIGDSGTTEASRPSTRSGMEWSNVYSPYTWLTIDADISVSMARYRNSNPSGDHVPQAIQTVFASGISFEKEGYIAAIRVRYFGPRPLIEDDSIRSSASTIWNLRLGKKIRDSWSVNLEVFNLMNSLASQIQYYYPTRLKNEPPGPNDGGYNDILTHPVPPRNIRISLSINF